MVRKEQTCAQQQCVPPAHPSQAKQAAAKQSLKHRVKLIGLKCSIVALVATVATFAFIQFASSSRRETVENPKRHCQQAKRAILNWRLGIDGRFGAEHEASSNGWRHADAASRHGESDEDDNMNRGTLSRDELEKMVKSGQRSQTLNQRMKFSVARELAYAILIQRCKIFELMEADRSEGSQKDPIEAQKLILTFEDVITQTIAQTSQLASLVDSLGAQLPESFVKFMELFVFGIKDPHIFQKIDL